VKIFARIVASALCFSVVCGVFGAEQSWKEISDRFNSFQKPDDAIADYKKSIGSVDPDRTEMEIISEYETTTKPSEKRKLFNRLKSYLETLGTAENLKFNAKATAQAKQIKSNVMYRIEKRSEQANWFEKVFERLKGIFKPSTPNFKPPNIPSWVGTALKVILYCLLAVAVIGLIYLLTLIPRNWKLSRGRAARRSAGLLEDGEVLLTEDEYLTQADEFILAGKYREALRYLYLACLLRLDHARVARFEPTETNWEHLRRIESSKSLPTGLEFRALTKQFDLGWYGSRTISTETIQSVRSFYIQLKQSLEAQK
jgi:hypothetical protein